VLFPKHTVYYFTLVTSQDRATTITPQRTVSMFPPLLLNPKMVKTSPDSPMQNKTEEAMGTARTHLKNSETQASL